MDTTEDLIILTHGDYVRLRRAWKTAGFDVCYSAQIEQPLRLDWSPELFDDPEFVRQLQAHRPAEACFRIASVRLIKKGNWFRPDHYAVTFHAVGTLRDTAFQQYLTEQHVRSSSEVSRARLASV